MGTIFMVEANPIYIKELVRHTKKVATRVIPTES